MLFTGDGRVVFVMMSLIAYVKNVISEFTASLQAAAQSTILKIINNEELRKMEDLYGLQAVTCRGR